jgi:predicted nuclease with TOPRIM domain
MASTYPSSREHDHPHGERPRKGCPECDLGALDDLKCVAEGVKAQADYNASKQTELDARRTQFDGARDAYSEARASVREDVKTIRDQLTRIRDQLVCQLPEDVLECLKDAWEEVRERLEYCGMPTGCCIDDDCEFDDSCENVSTDDLEKRKAEYERRVKAAEECFDQLIKEPADLKERVAKLKADVEALAKDTSDVRKSYARFLWYWRRLEDIWLGFEHASEYHDCLCQALMCSVKGHRAIGVLVGEIAVRACRERSEKARCDWLKTHVVDEILARCHKHPKPKPYGDEEEPPKQSTA